MFAKAQVSYEAVKLQPRAVMTDKQMCQAALVYFKTMQQCRMVRDFTDQEVPTEVIQDCVRTAGSAPSGANHQP
tara:strand:- start:446 stop:667 length:222 start_codon:yes stop_codon:yes gene_type:complete